MNEVQQHYTVPELEERILAALAETGTAVDSLGPDDLAPVDEFHVRGRESTVELAELVRPQPDWSLLDVGCGIGGTCRYLATACGCRTTGVDLTAEYCATATRLSERVGLSDRTTFRQASALDLPFEADSFDAAWTEHAQMNIADKRRFYAELHRVVRPGGLVAFHDIFLGAAGDPYFPVPWAADPSISFLAPVAETNALVRELGFDVEHWADRTADSLAWFRATIERIRVQGPSPIGIHLLMGETSPDKLQNVVRNLDEGRIAVAMAVLRKRA